MHLAKENIIGAFPAPVLLPSPFFALSVRNPIQPHWNRQVMHAGGFLCVTTTMTTEIQVQVQCTLSWPYPRM